VTRGTRPAAPPAADATDATDGDPLALIQRSLRGLRFGQITIQVHDGAVVQIEVTEKLRPRR
jgi:hypothetical protein